MRTNIYIDGFNLYYGCLKGSGYKWLNLRELCETVFPKNKINRIRYFTAKVQPTLLDPRIPQRQSTYIRALETTPCLSVHYGIFKSRVTSMPLAYPVKGQPRMVDVVKTEEKGSDVNLATYLLVDGYEGDYEVAIVISNDSDLVEPIRIVRERLKIPVGVLNPQRNPKKRSIELMSAATFRRSVRPGVLQQSQFPEHLTDKRGSFRKPEGW